MSGRAAHKRRLALLAILAVARGRTIARERLVALLWPDTPTQAGRHSLSESLSVLRREIDEELFVCAGDDLGLNLEKIRCDVATFEAALEAGDREAVVGLYRGPFLDGFYVSDAPDFERWAEVERDRLGRAYARALESLADAAEQSGDLATAGEWLRRLATHDPYSSRVAMRLLEVLDRAGEREAALRHASVHAAFLREELGTEPSSELRALVERLRQQPAPPITASTAFAPAPESASREVEGGGGMAEAAPVTAPTGAGEPRRAIRATDRAAGEGGFATGREDAGTADATGRRRAAVWFADVVGYTALLEADPAGAATVLALLYEAARKEVRRGNGHVVELIGDGVLAEFTDPVKSARAAVRLVRAFERRTRAAGVGCTLRVGIHLGEVTTTDDGSLYGEPVSLAPRLQERGEPGQVIVSGETRAALRTVPEFRFAARGTLVVPERPAPVGTFDLHLARREGVASPVLPGALRRGGRPDARRWAVAVLALVLALSVTAVAVAALRARNAARASDAAPLPANRVAVFFQDQSSDHSLEHLARGLTDQLIYELSQVEVLDVVPPSGVRRFRDTNLRTDSVAAALGAGTLLECSLHRSGDRLRLYLHMVDAATGQRLRSKVLQATMDDPFALEDRLAREAARFLRWRLGRNLEVRVHSSGTRSARARELVLRAEQVREDADSLLNARDSLQVVLGKRQLAYADSLLLKAEQADPRWSMPPALRAAVVVDLARHSGLAEERRLLREARAHVDRALRLRAGDPRALETRGKVLWTLSLFPQPADSAEVLVDAAVRDLQAAVGADPRRADAWTTLSQLLRFQGDHQGSYFAAHQAFRADVYLLNAAAVRYHLFRSSLAFGRFDLAEQQCTAGASESPNRWWFSECKLVILARTDTGAVDPAVAESVLAALEAAHLKSVGSGGDPYQPLHWRMLYAAVLARAREHDRARAEMARARSQVGEARDRRASFAYDEAHVLLFLGDRAGAIQALAEMVRLQPFMRRSVANDYLFRTLRSDPAFRAAVTGG